ncbi:FecCD family ABC transporter permease [Polymorphospora rubra]|uniref:FecCD family ABC transporter permease n=1 Tax=Polymorphospora rubra TaxID=338584 RepID=UPI00340E794D
MTISAVVSDVPRVRGGAHRALVLAGVAAALLALVVLSLFVGSGDITAAQSWQALRGIDTDSPAGIIVRDYRVPRTVLAVLVGAGLGVAGAVTQALTRNPLADPGILGVNSGGFFFVAVAAGFLGITSIAGYVWFALLGAMVTSILVYVVGTTGRQGTNPIKIVLTGVAVGAVFTGISYGITLTRPDVFDRIRFWQAGSLQGRQLDVVVGVAPFLLAGVLLAVMLTAGLNALALGDDVARSLGTRTVVVRATGFVAIALLCGAATAAVGPLSFVGLMVPHAVRMIAGPDQRRVVPLCVLTAPVLMLTADIVGRVLLDNEVPVGIVVAFLGAPLLIWLVRRPQARAL